MTESSAPEKILIIEDEALIARELRHRLTSMGWEVVGTAFGEDAVELARETVPDLILSDINLRHGLSGIDVSQRIQENMEVPVVFLTAYSDKDTVARAKEQTPYGYIIKPVDNRDLQITIEMALYKFRAEKELKKRQQLLETAFACIGSALLFLDDAGHVIDANTEASELLGQGDPVGKSARALLGEQHPAMPAVEQSLRESSLIKLSPFLMHRDQAATRLVDGVVGPMDHGAVIILRDLGDIEDAVRREPGERFARLGADVLNPSESTFCQLLISPDISDDAARHAIIDDIKALLDPHLRVTDLMSAFGHSFLLISLPYTTQGDGESIADSLMERLADYRYNGESVSFSAGLASSSDDEQEPIELFKRATVALETAWRLGGGRLCTGDGDKAPGSIEAATAGSYRQVVLLWNIMNTLASAPDPDAMAVEFCRQLFAVFGADRVALLTPDDQQVLLQTGFVKGQGQTENISELNLNAREFAVIQGVARGEVRGQPLHNTLVVAIADRWVLLVSGIDLDDDDESFLLTLASYFASSLDRFSIASEDERVSEPPPEPRLVFASDEMTQVLETANLAAPTDATVLLFGESGTGKELVARYIHEHGPRRDQPLVVVDCGAVSPSLIESELFGHVKGAFTGATSNFAGRLKDAAGGTVLLDEIGELPLETQVKLLRFVQDRQLAAVGSNQYETVDARVIAATHRDLKDMVDRGEFREDLYYRLNVFTVSVPPLRDRKADILKIAGHYLQMFAARYRKPATRFSDDARRVLLEYDWPGNIRELSNVVNRAVILSKDEQITPIQLGLFHHASGPAASQPPGKEGISVLLKQVVDVGISVRDPLPVGRYLEEDFILLSISRHDGVLNRAAMNIAVPESTLRRKIQKIEADYGSMDPHRPENWPITPGFYSDLMQLAAARESQPLDLLAALLVAEIEARQLNKSRSARLLGVSLPTYRRLTEEIANIF